MLTKEPQLQSQTSQDDYECGELRACACARDSSSSGRRDFPVKATNASRNTPLGNLSNAHLYLW